MSNSTPTAAAAATRNVSDLCLDATEIMSSGSFRSVLFVSVFESILAVLLNLSLMLTIGKVSVFHSNLRWLLFHHSFTLSVFSLAIGSKAAYMLVVGMVLNDPCRLITTAYDCKVQELVYIVPMILGIYSLITLSVERLYATLRYRTYESTSKPWLACVLIPCAWLIVLLNQCLPLKEIPRSVFMPVCSNLLALSPALAKSVLVPNVTIEMVGLLLTIVLYVCNNRLLERSQLNRAKHTLAARFQISQNVAVNRLLLPTAVVHASTYMFQSAYLLSILMGLGLDDGKKMLMIQISCSVSMAYAIAHPTLAFVRNPHLRKLVRPWANGCLPRFVVEAKKMKTNAVGQRPGGMATTTGGQAHFHFKALHEFWSRQETVRGSRKS